MSETKATFDRAHELIGNVELSRLVAERRVAIKKVFDTACLFSFSGGIFRADAEFIAFVTIVTQQREEAVFIDEGGIPILITNTKELEETALAVYHEASNAYLEEYRKLEKMRTKGAALA